MPIFSERLSSQLLAGPPASDPVAVAERILAVQAQDLRATRLALRARTTGLSSTDIDRALTDDRSLLITWLNRGTLHLVRSQDYWWLHALTTPPLHTGNMRRLAQEGVSAAVAERAVTVIERTLADEGPLERDRLRDQLAKADVPTKGQAFAHLLMLASNRGLIVRGPMVHGKHAYVLVHDWLGRTPPTEKREDALAELARRYLGGHGPADQADLARWAGLPVRDARTGLKAIASQLHQRKDGLIELRRRSSSQPPPEPRLLGAFEPVLLGWRSRQWVTGDHESRLIAGGIFRAFALVQGRAAATWTITRQGIGLDPFAQLGRTDRYALEREADDVRRFLAS